MFRMRKKPWELSDDGTVRFQQKRAGRRVRLAIDNGGVDYEVKDSSGEVKFRATFEEIDPQATEISERSAVALRCGALFLFIGFFIAAGGLLVSSEPAGESWISAAFWSLLGAGCLIYHYARRVSFSILRTDHGRIVILRDERHDDILRELNLRRVALLRSKYLPIDRENNSRAEISKYNWLRKVGAITDVEYSQFNSMLQDDLGELPDIQPPTISLN